MAATAAVRRGVIGADLYNEWVAFVNGTTPPSGKSPIPLKNIQFSSPTVYAEHVNQVDTTNGLIQKWSYGPADTPTTVATMTKNGLAFTGGRPWVDLTGFGADPTGATASDTAIEAWLLAGAGGYCYAPAGTYLINSAHTVPAGTRIVCAGQSVTIFKRKTTFDGIMFTLGASAQIADCTLDGDAPNGNLNHLPAGLTQIQAEVYLNGDRARMDRVSIVNPTAQFSWQATGSNITVADCTFTGNNEGTTAAAPYQNTSAFQTGGVATPYLSILRCAFTNFNWGSGTVGPGALVQGCYFANNHISDTPSPGTHIGVSGTTTTGARILGNYFGPNSTRASGGMEVDQGAGGTVISGNVFVGSGVYTAHGALAGSGIFAATSGGNPLRHLTIANNVVINWPGAGIAIGAASSGDIDDCTINGNVCFGNGRSGINVLTTSFLVDGNICANNGQDTGVTDRAGIYVNANCAWFALVGNRCFDTAGGSGKQQWGIQVAAGTSDQYVISGNALVGNVNADGLSDGGSGTSKQIFGNLPATAPARLLHAGDILVTGALTSSSPTAGVGYATGAGGTVAQSTSKATTVALNAATGTITMNAAALAAGTPVTFTFTNSAIAATDLLLLNHTSGGTAGAYLLNAQVGAGNATVNVRNITAGSLSEAIVLRFAVVKGVTS